MTVLHSCGLERGSRTPAPSCGHRAGTVCGSSHNCRMAPSIRSLSRSAQVNIRMAPELRDALNLAARRRNTNVHALMLSVIEDLAREPQDA